MRPTQVAGKQRLEYRAWMCDPVPTPRLSENISEAKRRAVVFLLTLFHLRKRMGGFLDKPKTEKTHECGQGNGLKYGVVSMQGWRVEMEDSHSAVTGLSEDFKGTQVCSALISLVAK